jgi:MYXO-CTERM domain-containing protein
MSRERRDLPDPCAAKIAAIAKLCHGGCARPGTDSLFFAYLQTDGDGTCVASWVGMPRTSGTVVSVFFIALALGAPRVARAEVVRNELDSVDALTADGWFYNQMGGTATSSGSLLRLQTTQGYNEFLLGNDSTEPPPTKGWVGTVDAGRGWWVEARLRVAAATQCAGGGPGLWANDGKLGVRLLFDASGAHYVSAAVRDLPVASTSEFHTYRIQSLGNRHVQVIIDGKLASDEPTFSGQASSRMIAFGDLGGCNATDTTWDYVAYDTFGPGAVPGDDDQDGVDNASDNCALLANADQKNGDGDGAGDACDVCPQDAQNDEDNDGKCAEVDVCPSDARNDQDNNGVCDTMQCAPYLNVVFPPGSCPPVCNCLPIGNDPIGGFGNLDNFGGSYGLAGLGGAGVGNGGAAKGGATGQGGASNQAAGSANTNANSATQGSSADVAGCACVAAGAKTPHAPAVAGLGLLGMLALSLRRRRH